MTHPHRINTCTNADIVKGIVFGGLQGWLSVAIPSLVIWYFFGDMLQPKPPTPPPQIENGVKI